MSNPPFRTRNVLVVSLALLALFCGSIITVSAAGTESRFAFIGEVGAWLGMPAGAPVLTAAKAEPTVFAASPSISLTTSGATYNQTFDSLVSTGTGTETANTPAGWTFLESGTSANTTYTAGSGSLATGDTYSF